MNSNQSFEHITRMKIACSRIYANKKDLASIKELQNLIDEAQPTIVKTLEPVIFSVFVPVLKSISESSENYKEKEKQQIVDTFKVFFEKISIEKLSLFFNIYGFLLFEIYDHKNHSVSKISEEYKLSIVECMSALVKCLDSLAVESLYVKENAPKLCQMIYVVIEIAKNDQFRTLRLAAIKCLMAIAHVLENEDFEDVVLRNQIAEVFLFFLPGIATHLKTIALTDEKFGHQIPSLALKAWGRIVTLLMQDYNAIDAKINLELTAKLDINAPKTRWKSENELQDYIKNTSRSPAWYRETDKKLQKLITEFTKLTHHSHPKVRSELVNLSALLIKNCVNTMPASITHLIDLIIICSEDEDDLIAEKSVKILNELSEKLTSKEFKHLLDNLEENFYNVVNGIPRKFNGIDEKAQIVALNSLIGYISLFGKHALTQILHSPVHLNRLVLTLIHISEFERSNISILEEYRTTDYELNENLKTSWKQFRHFEETEVLTRIERICHLLAKYGASQIISDFLLDVFSTSENNKEAVFLLNEIVAGIEVENKNLNIIKNIISTYVDGTNWYLPLSVMIDDYGYEVTLGDVQNNIIVVCLLVEGLGKIALALKQDYKQFLLKTLYLVLERAGSAHPLIRNAGLLSLTNICEACGYATITELINKNIDYFSFHIERKLSRASESSGGLNVLAVVIKYSTKEVLNSTCEVIQELLFRTSNKNLTNLDSHFHVFKMFILGLHKWLNIQIEPHCFKTKQQKQEESEDFQVSNIEEIDRFSDDIMGKTAEEMYKEDMEKTQQEIEDEIEPQDHEYKKPKPPIHIRLTVEILTQSLHYLPSKNQARKLLILEILTNGVYILKEWEDELLPIVHQIWSPLVDRFKDDPLVINLSFQLLIVLAQLSKEFIRSRTSKEVLPNILAVLEKLAPESYLKDRGSAYRYSQNYKLQVTILENLAQVVTDLDMVQEDFHKCSEVVFRYISDKQPAPLQNLSLNFFKLLITYDENLMESKLKSLTSGGPPEFAKNSAILLGYLNK